MAVAFRTSGTAEFVATASPVVAKPAGIQDGDLIVVFVATDTTHTFGALAGWDDIWLIDQGTDTSVSAVSKIASSEGSGSWTLTNYFGGAESGSAGVVVYSGVDTSNPIPAASIATLNSSSGTVKTWPSITPPRNGCMVVGIMGADPGALGRNAAPSGSPLGTERVDFMGAVVANGWVYAQDYLQTTAAAVTQQATLDAADGVGMIHFAVQPPAAATKAPTFVRRRLPLLRR